MAEKHAGGCDHINTHTNNQPIDIHICHCSICKRVTGQETTHVVMFKHSDLEIDDSSKLNRQPLNEENPSGPLELCTCSNCGTPVMVDDKQQRVRIVVPNLMGYKVESMPATYHAFFDPTSDAPTPDDGRPVYEGLHPDFVWPDPA